MPKTAYRARYVLTERNELLKNAVIYVSSAGHISSIEQGKSPSVRPGVPVVDWGSAVIIPGLINAHAHLELTALHGQLTQFTSFSDWIFQLISRRRLWAAKEFKASALEGAKQCISTGTTLVGDITSSGVGWKAIKGSKLRRVVFEEIVSLSPDRADQVLRRANSLFKRAEPNPLQRHGISPHAPYSVSSKLYKRAAEQARRRRMPLAAHVAETKSELEFLQNGTGDFINFLRSMGALPERWRPPELAPIQYFQTLGLLGRNCLLIHCNYVDQEAIRIIKKTRSNVAYCPRSHAFFGHDRHPVRALLDNGVNVALGTDSLASNSSLSMLDEMQFLFKTRKDIKPAEIFRAATLGGAVALDAGKILGRLHRGYAADMAVLELPQNVKPKRLLSQVLEGAGKCIATIVQGQIAWQEASENSDPECYLPQLR